MITDQKIDTLITAIRNLDQKMDQRFDEVDIRFKDIDIRFNEIDQRFNDIDQRFEGVDQRFERIDEQFRSVDSRFTDIESHLSDIDSRFINIDSRFSGIENTLVDHSQLLQDMSAAYVAMSHKLDTVIRQTSDLPVIRDDLAYLKVKSANAENSISKIYTQLITMESKDDYLLDRVEKIDEKLGRISARQYA
jgi:chromosome segregation ATPase